MIPESSKILASLIPDLNIKNILKITEGWDSQVFVVNSARVYKIPNRTVKNSIAKEFLLLKALKPALGQLIPSDPELCVYHEGSNRIDVLAYDFIPGITLDRSLPLDSQSETVIAASFFRILQAIHSIWLPDNSNFPRKSAALWRSTYSEMGKHFTAENFPEIGADIIDYIQSLINEFITSERNFRFGPTLIHGDIDPRNIIWNETEFRVTGLIDWAEATYGDPAFDAASLFFQEGLGLKYLKMSGIAGDAGAIERVEFYHKMVPVYWIEYGKRNGDSPLMIRGIEELIKRKNFSIRL